MIKDFRRLRTPFGVVWSWGRYLLYYPSIETGEAAVVRRAFVEGKTKLVPVARGSFISCAAAAIADARGRK